MSFYALMNVSCSLWKLEDISFHNRLSSLGDCFECSKCALGYQVPPSKTPPPFPIFHANSSLLTHSSLNQQTVQVSLFRQSLPLYWFSWTLNPKNIKIFNLNSSSANKGWSTVNYCQNSAFDRPNWSLWPLAF